MTLRPTGGKNQPPPTGPIAPTGRKTAAQGNALGIESALGVVATNGSGVGGLDAKERTSNYAPNSFSEPTSRDRRDPYSSNFSRVSEMSRFRIDNCPMRSNGVNSPSPLSMLKRSG